MRVAVSQPRLPPAGQDPELPSVVCANGEALWVTWPSAQQRPAARSGGHERRAGRSEGTLGSARTDGGDTASLPAGRSGTQTSRGGNRENVLYPLGLVSPF